MKKYKRSVEWQLDFWVRKCGEKNKGTVDGLRCHHCPQAREEKCDRAREYLRNLIRYLEQPGPRELK